MKSPGERVLVLSINPSIPPPPTCNASHLHQGWSKRINHNLEHHCSALLQCLWLNSPPAQKYNVQIHNYANTEILKHPNTNICKCWLKLRALSSVHRSLLDVYTTGISNSQAKPELPFNLPFNFPFNLSLHICSSVFHWFLRRLESADLLRRVGDWFNLNLRSEQWGQKHLKSKP